MVSWGFLGNVKLIRTLFKGVVPLEQEGVHAVY